MSGPDSARFLHGMLACDVKQMALKTPSCTRSFLLEANGRIRSELYVLALSPEEFLITFPEEVFEEAKEALDRYLIADDARIEDEAAFHASYLVREMFSKGAREELQAEAVNSRDKIFRLLQHDWGYECPSYAMGEEGALLLLNRELESVKAGEAQDWDEWRVENSCPLWGKDYSVGDLVVEHPVADALSFSKGCFMGQEVVAKATIRGKPPRYLAHIDGLSDDPSSELCTSDEKKVGELKTRTTSSALALVRRPILESGDQLFHAGKEVEVKRVLTNWEL